MMRLVIFMVLTVIVLCDCENGEEAKRVQRREAYNSQKDRGQERDHIYPNDFILMREPPRPGSNQEPFHHHHGPYHNHNGGPPDHFHHYHEFTSNPTDHPDYEFSSLNSSGIPLDFAKSISDYSVSDLLLNFIEDGPAQLEEKPFITSRFGDDGNETERNAAQPARPAKCNPELTTVRIAQSNDPNVFYVPECTRIERCGGCCSHVLLSCQPVETETVTFSVIKTEYTGHKKLKYVGKEPVLVERHTKCKCGCKVKAEDCNSYQEYRETECRCVCKNLDEEKKCYRNSYKKLWNPDVCACQCRDIEPCSTGFQFDYNECRCIQSQLKRRYILTETRKEQPEMPPTENID